MSKNMNINIEEKNISRLVLHNDCTGCRMCEQICPKSAIGMIENNEGFLEPQIDKSKCINCGLCLKKCPQYNNNLGNTPIKCYAGKNKNIEQLKIGSSGSIFKIIADYVIDNSGAVYGAAFNENLDLNTIRVVNKNDLIKLTGSKYIQCNTNKTFKTVKDDLQSEKFVLYTGTPCQIAGLKSYLNVEYDKLITIDLVCHGVPSHKLFNEYIKYLEKKYNSKVINYNFRCKEKNGWGLNSKVILKNGEVKYINSNLDCYYKSFLDAKTYREVCYNCKYANINRVGDITLADYWGIQKVHPNFDPDLGASAIMINTKKGEYVFKNIKNKVEFIETDIQKIALQNKNLIKPSDRPQVRDFVYNDLCKKDFKIYIKENLKFNKKLKDIVKNIIPVRIKKIIKKCIRSK